MTDTRQPSRFSEGFYLYDTPAYPGALTDDDMQVMRRMKSDVRIDNYSIWHYEAGLNETDAHSPASIVKADDAERAIEARMTASGARKTLWQHYLDYRAHVTNAGLAPGDYEQWLFNQPEYRNANLEERAAFRALAEPFDVYEDTPAPDTRTRLDTNTEFPAHLSRQDAPSGEPYEQYLARKATLPTVDQIRAEWNLPENVEASENSAFVNGAYHPIILDIAALLNENAALREQLDNLSKEMDVIKAFHNVAVADDKLHIYRLDKARERVAALEAAIGLAISCIDSRVMSLVEIAAEPDAWTQYRITGEDKGVVIDRIDNQITHYLSELKAVALAGKDGE